MLFRTEIINGLQNEVTMFRQMCLSLQTEVCLSFYRVTLSSCEWHEVLHMLIYSVVLVAIDEQVSMHRSAAAPAKGVMHRPPPGM